MCEDITALARFISCDWGTTHVRLRLACLPDGALLATHRSDRGVKELDAQANGNVRVRKKLFETTFLQALHVLEELAGARLATLPVLISGMASSSVGWRELPYATMPLSLNHPNLVTQRLSLPGHNGAVYLISGVRSDNDVMRGEETEAMGCWRWLHERRRVRRCIMVFPGTHSKHLRVRGGAVIGFRTFITGELFALLRTHSILRHSTTTTADKRFGRAEVNAFLEGVDLAAAEPLASAVFRVRTNQILHAQSAAAGSAMLSGVLIGHELAQLRQDRQHEPILLCGAGGLSEHYLAAARALRLSKRIKTLPPEIVEVLPVQGHCEILERFRHRVRGNR
jgi:2-dehydro-3-deoxygalactonokinase